MVRHRLVGDELAFVELRVLSLVAVDTVLDLVAERPDQALHRPGCCVSQSADSVTLDLVGELFEHVDFSEVSVAELHALEHIDHPASTLTAGCALAAALVSVELRQTEDGVDDVGLVVHDDDSSGTETRPAVLQVIEVHDGLRALLLVEHGHRGATWDDGLEVVPATNDTATVSVNKLSERDAHFLLNSDWVVDVTTDAEELGARVLVTAEAVEPACSTAHDRRADGHSLHVSHSGRAAVQSSVGWERGLHAGATGLALETLDERRLLATDVGASATVHVDIEVVARVASVLAEEALFVGLIDSSLKLDLLVPELATDVDVGSLGTHAEADDKSALDELVWVVSEDLTVLASARLRLIRVDNQVGWSAQKMKK